MNIYSLTHLANATLLSNLTALVTRERANTAQLLAHIAEVDARKLYLAAAYPSMYFYCVGELRLSEDAACKRIRAARVARDFPAVFDALAEGRLSLSGVVLLAPQLTPETAPEIADELLAAAAYKTKSEIELLLARRFPRRDVPTQVRAIVSSPPATLLTEPSGAEPAELSAPGRIEIPAPRAKMSPLAPKRFALQVTIGQATHDKLRHAQALLGPRVAAGDVAQVLDRALDALIQRLEKTKFAATTRPRGPRPSETSAPRYVPADVRRAVWERDQGQCTFVSETGKRCAARGDVEFDHIREVARGGKATVGGIRLRCRAHNQYGAECTFGAEFMNAKREEARRRAAERAAAQARSAAEQDPDRSVIPWLLRLGFKVDEARRAASLCEAVPDAPLERQVRVALSYFSSRGTPGRGATAHGSPG